MPSEEVSDLVRPPDWRREESLLALELYLRSGSALSANAPEVLRLSDRLRMLKIWPAHVRSNPRFRNPAGVALKLHNFAAIDPKHPGGGMPNGSGVDRTIWNSWVHRPGELQAVARQIVMAATTHDLTAPVDDEADVCAEEGDSLYRLHRKIERDRNLVKRKKQHVLTRTGRLACEVCDFESTEIYGSSVSVIDVHHIVPLHQIGKGVTKLSELALVCPTCHRVLHAHRPILTPAQLKVIRERI